MLADAREAHLMTRDKQENGVWIEHAAAAGEAGAKAANFVLIAGQPLDQPVMQYGPFVVSTRQEVQQTLMDFQLHMNGFEKAMGWESKIARRARSNSFS